MQEQDIVYFQKKEGHLDNKWIIGRIDQVVRGRDQKIRKVIIRYSNASEENMPRFTERSARKLVKLFSVDEFQIQDDLTELQKRIERLQSEHGLPLNSNMPGEGNKLSRDIPCHI